MFTNPPAVLKKQQQKKETVVRGSWFHLTDIYEESWDEQNNIPLGRFITILNENKDAVHHYSSYQII